MSIYGEWKSATIATGTLSAAVDLGRDYELLQIIMPAITSCVLSVQVLDTLAGTYLDLGSSNTTATTTGSRADVFKLGGWRYIKIKSSVSQTAETFTVRGMRV